MFIFLLIFGLVFLVGGGIGLFNVNVHLTSTNELWFYGNLTFGVFTMVGIMIIVFLALFNAEID
jgi:hypothetical protein